MESSAAVLLLCSTHPVACVGPFRSVKWRTHDTTGSTPGDGGNDPIKWHTYGTTGSTPGDRE